MYLCARAVSTCQTCNTGELIGCRIHNTSLIHPTIEIGEAIHTLMATCDLVANTVRTAGWHTTLTLETNGATLNAVAEETIIAIQIIKTAHTCVLSDVAEWLCWVSAVRVIGTLNTGVLVANRC